MSTQPNFVMLGRFGRSHGVRGEVRLQSFTADPLDIGTYGPLTGPDGRQFVLNDVRPAGAMLIARVAGVTTREAAEALSGIELSVPREKLPAPDEDEFMLADLVGCDAVLADGTVLGRVLDVANYGAGDLLDVQPARGGPSLLLPFTLGVVPVVDIAARRVVIDPPAGLFET